MGSSLRGLTRPSVVLFGIKFQSLMGSSLRGL
jgi:hypothetical protein